MKIRCLVVDDEPLARDVLENYVKRVNSLELVASCSNAIEAFEYLHKDSIDLVFLDINMPEITGIDFAKSLKNAPSIIFTTAYSEFAIEGFNLNAVDYLLKPFPFDRFLTAVNKVMELKTASSTPSASAPVAPVNEKEDYIFIKTDKKMVKVNYADIYYIEGLKDYIMIHTDEKRYITLMTMKSLAERLPSNQFIRTHKSYIIAFDRLKSIMGNAIEIKDKLLPIGKMYKEGFFEMVEKHNLIK